MVENQIFPQKEIVDVLKNRFGENKEFELSTDSTKRSMFLRVFQDLEDGSEHVWEYQVIFESVGEVIRKKE